MDCRNFRKNLEDYLEGGLDFSGRFGMERHAQQCYVCGKEVAGAQKLSQLARDEHRVRAPQNFEASVVARIHARDSLSWFQRVRVYGLDLSAWRPLLVGAAAVTILGLGSLVIADRYLGIPGHRADTASAPGPAVPVNPVTGTPPAATELRAIPIDNSTVTRGSRTQLVGESLISRSGSRHPARYSTEAVRPGDPDYFEYSVPGPDGSQFIMRLPKTIRMRYGQPSEEYFIRNVSH